MLEHIYIKKVKKRPRLKRLTEKVIYERKQSYKIKNREKNKPKYPRLIKEREIHLGCPSCSEISEHEYVLLPRTFAQIPICIECYIKIKYDLDPY